MRASIPSVQRIAFFCAGSTGLRLRMAGGFCRGCTNITATRLTACTCPAATMGSVPESENLLESQETDLTARRRRKGPAVVQVGESQTSSSPTWRTCRSRFLHSGYNVVGPPQKLDFPRTLRRMLISGCLPSVSRDEVRKLRTPVRRVRSRTDPASERRIGKEVL